jgi:hypothetical protein
MAGTFVPAAGASYIVAGNVRFAAGVLTCTDGYTGTIPTGFHHVYHVQWSVKSAATNNFTKGFTFSSQSSLTAPTVTSGDDFLVAIWGV